MAQTSGIGGSTPRVPSKAGGVGRTGIDTGHGKKTAAAVEADARAQKPAEERQWIQIDGVRFDRNAPRGTYLNILV